jgi:uncharacterized membrane protein YcaP (DUF421 family)
MALLQNNYVQIALSSIAVYLFVIIAIRLFGKKELSQLSVIDLVFVLLIVQNAMVGSDSTLSGGLVAAASLFAANYIFKQFLYRFPKFSKIIQGESVLLVYNGVLNHKNIASAMLTMDELMEAVREHGVSCIEDVDLAILEVDGNISVLTHDFQTRTKRKRRSRQPEKKM